MMEVCEWWLLWVDMGVSFGIDVGFLVYVLLVFKGGS